MGRTKWWFCRGGLEPEVKTKTSGIKSEGKTKASSCGDYTTEFTCNLNDGCKWNGSICILDIETVTISAPKLDFSKGLGAAKKLLTQ